MSFELPPNATAITVTIRREASTHPVGEDLEVSHTIMVQEHRLEQIQHVMSALVDQLFASATRAGIIKGDDIG